MSEIPNKFNAMLQASPNRQFQHHHGPSTSGIYYHVYPTGGYSEGNPPMPTQSQRMRCPTNFNNHQGVPSGMDSWTTEDQYAYQPLTMRMNYFQMDHWPGQLEDSYSHQLIDDYGNIWYNGYPEQGATFYREQQVPQPAFPPSSQYPPPSYQVQNIQVCATYQNFEAPGPVTRDSSMSPIMTPAARVVPNRSRSSSGSPAQKPKFLPQFLKNLLATENNGCLKWINYTARVFQILPANRERLAELWDKNKGHADRKSFHDRLRRGIDYNSAPHGKPLIKIDEKDGIFQFVEPI